MADVDDSIIEDAAKLLGVTRVNQLKGGGQKAVEVVDLEGESLVMKVISVGSSEPDKLRRAEREVDLLASIDSDYVVAVASRLVEVGEPVTGAAWLEEHLDGEDLADKVGAPWDWSATRSMALDVAKGLAAAHEKKVVHRDLSAGNVRGLSDGTYKVMDFGFARYTLRSGLTMGGQPGTPGFASPEHLQGYSGGPTAASDVFALGILMYLALTGEQPIAYRGDDADYFRRLAAVQMDDIGVKRPDLTDDQMNLVRRCLHAQSARRYLNGGMLADALEATP
jgi:serine/threonine protein kinase